MQLCNISNAALDLQKVASLTDCNYKRLHLVVATTIMRTTNKRAYRHDPGRLIGLCNADKLLLLLPTCT